MAVSNFIILYIKKQCLQQCIESDLLRSCTRFYVAFYNYFHDYFDVELFPVVTATPFNQFFKQFLFKKLEPEPLQLECHVKTYKN